MKSEANFVLVLITCVFFGALGIHRFMVGKIGTGVLMILLAITGISTIWQLVDLVMLCTGNFTDKAGRQVAPMT